MSEMPPSPMSAELLMTATLFLMTQFVLQQRGEIAAGVADHFHRLLQVEDGLSPRLRQAIGRLHAQWASIANIAARPATPAPATCQIIAFPSGRMPRDRSSV